jgi:RNA polymerase sigma-70 factor (ECF subfamily)
LPEIADPWGAQNRPFEMDDACFVARCRQGDTEAFSVLVRRHQKKMLNLAYRMIGNYDEACDVVQEAFLAAFRAIKKFRGDSLFSTWLNHIVLNQAKSHLKKRTARFHREGELDEELSRLGSGADLGGSCSPEESAFERIEKQELEAKVQECLSSLDGEQREVLVLRDIEGLSYEVIGQTLKLPQGTVRSRLFRARNTLKNRLLKRLGSLK